MRPQNTTSGGNVPTSSGGQLPANPSTSSRPPAVTIGPPSRISTTSVAPRQSIAPATSNLMSLASLMNPITDQEIGANILLRQTGSGAQSSTRHAQGTSGTARASTSARAQTFPAMNPGLRLTLSPTWVKSFNRKATKDLLKESFGNQEDYKTVLQNIVDSINAIAQNANQPGQSPLVNAGKGMWRVTVPVHGTVTFAVTPKGEIDAICKVDTNRPREMKAIENKMRKNVSTKKERQTYAQQLRLRHGGGLPTQSVQQTGIQLRDVQLNHAQLSQDPNFNAIPSRRTKTADRFNGGAFLHVMSTVITEVNALITQARQRNQPLQVRQPGQQFDIFVIGVPNPAGQPNFINEPYTVVLRLDAAGQVVDFDRADGRLQMAVADMRLRARKVKDRPKVSQSR